MISPVIVDIALPGRTECEKKEVVLTRNLFMHQLI